MWKKRAFAALLTAGLSVLSACGGSFEQPQYTVSEEQVPASQTAETTIETDWLAKLTELAPPPEKPKCTGTDEMRRAVEERLGTKLPDDYIELINTYGDGCFGYTFNVYNPFSDNKSCNLLTNDEKTIYEDLKRSRIDNGIYSSDGKPADNFSKREANGIFPTYCGFSANEGLPFDYFPARNGILACCKCAGQYTIYWRTSGDSWTIVAYSRNAKYSEFKMTLTEFLYKEMTQEIVFEDLYSCHSDLGNVFIPSDTFSSSKN